MWPTHILIYTMCYCHYYFYC